MTVSQAGLHQGDPYWQWHKRDGSVKSFFVDAHTFCTYNVIMKFEWDEKKRRSNIIKHGIDFSDAIELFKEPFLILKDNRQDYGEERYIGIGIINNRIIVLSFTERVEKIRIISMRKANNREQ